MQGTHARVAAPGENQLACTAGADQLVVDQVGCHAHQRQVFLALTNDFMTCRRRDQVSKAFECNGVAVIHELLYRISQRKDFSHGVGSRYGSKKALVAAPKCLKIKPEAEAKQSDNRLSVRLSNKL